MQFVSMPASATMFEQMMRRIIRMGSESIPEIVLHSSGGAASIYTTSSTNCQCSKAISWIDRKQTK